MKCLVLFLISYGRGLRLVPQRHHLKNMIEPNNGPILSLFLRLKASDDKVLDALLAIRAIQISNDLYGSDTLSSF